MLNKKVMIVSLGCDKNLVDTEKMLGILADEGCTFTDDEAQAQVIIVNTCSLHFGQLVAKRTAFHVEIVRKLLTAVRNVEGKTTRFFDVFRKKRKKPLPDRFGHSVKHPFGKSQVFFGAKRKQILYQFCVSGAGARTRVRNTAHTDKKHRRIL